ncbi:putative ATP-dependent RNA helicase ddx43 [Gigaspora margarita]|uniref:Putative ATP-dependent RNA helicase ddx43 n=1 Tax=Gigaspora margarita TaxID=4874 RepID=A0A8H3WXC8_GIGMA|nr:putative ATP-dependent RNA helicase ddx43 [Gigaspora margarita]
METVTINVPPSSIGHIKGKYSSKLNEIVRRSNAKCIIKKNNSVEVTGTTEARKIALNLIKDCVHNSIIVYSHPIEAIIALQPPLNGLKTVLFSKYDGIVDRNNFNKAYFILDKGEEMNGEDKLSLLFENLNLDTFKDIIAPKNDRISVEHITKRLIEQTAKPANKSLDFKVRVNIGKQLFYPAFREILYLPESIPLSDLLKYKIGYKKDAKTTFMNHVSSEVAKIIENRLIELDYQKNTDVIQRASIHLIDNKALKRFIVSTNITSDGKLIPRKFKSENNRLLFFAFAGPKSTLDFRFKVLTTEPSTTKLPTELENSIKNATYNLDTKTVTLNDTSNYLFTVTRIKIKNTFIKCKNEFSNGKIKLSISEVYEDGQKDVQVTVTSEALQKVIEKMSQTNKIEEELKLECDKEIEKFVNEVKTIVNELQYNTNGHY